MTNLKLLIVCLSFIGLNNTDLNAGTSDFSNSIPADSSKTMHESLSFNMVQHFDLIDDEWRVIMDYVPVQMNITMDNGRGSLSITYQGTDSVNQYKITTSIIKNIQGKKTHVLYLSDGSGPERYECGVEMNNNRITNVTIIYPDKKKMLGFANKTK